MFRVGKNELVTVDDRQMVIRPDRSARDSFLFLVLALCGVALLLSWRPLLRVPGLSFLSLVAFGFFVVAICWRIAANKDADIVLDRQTGTLWVGTPEAGDRICPLTSIAYVGVREQTGEHGSAYAVVLVIAGRFDPFHVTSSPSPRRAERLATEIAAFCGVESGVLTAAGAGSADG